MLVARKKLPDVPAFVSWDDVDAAMCSIGELENQITELQVDYDRMVARAKAEKEKDTKVLEANIKLLAAQVKQYVTSHQADMGDKKTKKLNHGQTGFRYSTKCIVPRGEKDAVLAKLHRLGLKDCIKTEESINKEVLKTKPEAIVKRAGCRLEKGDTFWYEVDHAKLTANQ